MVENNTNNNMFETKSMDTKEGNIIIAFVGLDNDSFTKVRQEFDKVAGYGLLRLDSMEQVDNNSLAVPDLVVISDKLKINTLPKTTVPILTVAKERQPEGSNILSLSEEVAKEITKNDKKNTITYLQQSLDIIIGGALQERRKKLYREQVEAIAQALNSQNGIDFHFLFEMFKAKDVTTFNHVQEVTNLTSVLMLGLEFSNSGLQLDDDEKKDLREIAMLHDLGKIVTPDQILKNDDALSNQEFSQMRRHVEINSELAVCEKTQQLLDLALKHHYRYDGNGYSDQQSLGIAGDNIPKLVRMITVLDSFEAITDTNRKYQKKEENESKIIKGFEILFNNSLTKEESKLGGQFDPKVAYAFLVGFKTCFESNDEFRNKWIEREGLATTVEQKQERSTLILQSLNVTIDKFNTKYGYGNENINDNNINR